MTVHSPVREAHYNLRGGPPLLVPLDRKRLQEPREPNRRPPVHDTLDDLRGEQGEAQDAADVRPADLLRRVLPSSRVSTPFLMLLSSLRAAGVLQRD